MLICPCSLVDCCLQTIVNSSISSFQEMQPAVLQQLWAHTWNNSLQRQMMVKNTSQSTNSQKQRAAKPPPSTQIQEINEEDFLPSLVRFSKCLLSDNYILLSTHVIDKIRYKFCLDEGTTTFTLMSPVMLRGITAHGIKFSCLDLSSSHIGDNNFTALSYLAPCLKSLSIRSTKVTDNGLAILSSFGQLEHLDIGNTAISGAVFRQWHKMNQAQKQSSRRQEAPKTGQTQQLSLMKLKYLAVDGSSMSSVGFSYLPFDMIASIEDLHLSANQLDEYFFGTFLQRIPLLRSLTLHPDKDQHPYLDMEFVAGVTDLSELQSLDISPGIPINLDILNYFNKNLIAMRESAGSKQQREEEHQMVEKEWEEEKEHKLQKHERKEANRKRGEAKTLQDLERKIKVAGEQLIALKKQGDDEKKIEELVVQKKKLEDQKEDHSRRMDANRQKRLEELEKEIQADEAAHELIRAEWATEEAEKEKESNNNNSYAINDEENNNSNTTTTTTHKLTSLTLNVNGVSPADLEKQLSVLGATLKGLTLTHVDAAQLLLYRDALIAAFPSLRYLGICGIRNGRVNIEDILKEFIHSLPTHIQRLHLSGEGIHPPLVEEYNNHNHNKKREVVKECPCCRGGIVWHGRGEEGAGRVWSFSAENMIKTAKDDIFAILEEADTATTMKRGVMWCSCPTCKGMVSKWKRSLEGGMDDEDGEGYVESGGRWDRREGFEKNGHKIKNREIMHGRKIVTKKERK